MNGKREGKWKITENDKLVEEGTYERNLRHGKWIINGIEVTYLYEYVISQSVLKENLTIFKGFVIDGERIGKFKVEEDGKV